MTETPTPVWATPTMLPTSAATPALNISGFMSGQDIFLAETIVQRYNWLNHNNILDYFIFVLLILIIIGGVWSITNRLKAWQ